MSSCGRFLSSLLKCCLIKESFLLSTVEPKTVSFHPTRTSKLFSSNFRHAFGGWLWFWLLFARHPFHFDMIPDLWCQLLVPTYLLPESKALKNIGQVILCSGWKETPQFLLFRYLVFVILFVIPWYNCTVVVILCFGTIAYLWYIFHICHPR